MEILKPEQLKEKFNDPWVAPYEKILTMVDGDKVEIVEYHPCISGSHWLLNQYRNNSELIDSAYRDGILVPDLGFFGVDGGVAAESVASPPTGTQLTLERRSCSSIAWRS